MHAFEAGRLKQKRCKIYSVRQRKRDRPFANEAFFYVWIQLTLHLIFLC